MIERIIAAVALYTPVGLYRQGYWSFEYSLLFLFFMIGGMLVFALGDIVVNEGEQNG